MYGVVLWARREGRCDTVCSLSRVGHLLGAVLPPHVGPGADALAAAAGGEKAGRVGMKILLTPVSRKGM